MTNLEEAYTAALMLPRSKARDAIIDALVREMRERALPPSKLPSEMQRQAVLHYRQVLRACSTGQLPPYYGELTLLGHAHMLAGSGRSRALVESEMRAEYAKRQAPKPGSWAA